MVAYRIPKDQPPAPSNGAPSAPVPLANDDTAPPVPSVDEHVGYRGPFGICVIFPI
jgi:hypothetical protein